MKLNRLIIYARDIEASAAFYETHFSFRRHQFPGDRIVELIPADGGSRILLHQAAKSQKTGQSSIKLIFDVEDVEAFCKRSFENGLVFGSIHKADGYVFANAKDPCGNSISVSSRAFKHQD